MPAPAILVALFRRWQAFGRAMGRLQARILLTVMYFVLLPPFALIVRLRGDALRLRPPDGPFWISRPDAEPTLDDLKRQY